MSATTTRFENMLQKLSLLFGLILTIGNIGLFWFTYDERYERDLAARPRFDVLYYEIDPHILTGNLFDPNSEKHFSDHTIFGKPIVKTGVENTHLDSEEGGYFFLSIRNIGGRRAEQIKLTFRKGTSTHENPETFFDPKDFSSLAEHAEEIEISIPDLKPQDGILIPIFAQDYIEQPGGLPLGVIAGDYYIPQSISFFDYLDNQWQKVDVRKMLSIPIYIRAGIAGRG